MPTFKQVIEQKKAALQAQLDVIDVQAKKEIAKVEADAKAAGKGIRFQMKRLDTMLAIYKEHEADFEKIEVQVPKKG